MSRNNQCETRFELFIMSTAAILRTQHDPALPFLKTRQTIRYNSVIVSVFLLLCLRWSLMKTGYCFTSFDLYSVILFFTYVIRIRLIFYLTYCLLSSNTFCRLFPLCMKQYVFNDKIVLLS